MKSSFILVCALCAQNTIAQDLSDATRPAMAHADLQAFATRIDFGDGSSSRIFPPTPWSAELGRQLVAEVLAAEEADCVPGDDPGFHVELEHQVLRLVTDRITNDPLSWELVDTYGHCIASAHASCSTIGSRRMWRLMSGSGAVVCTVSDDRTGARSVARFVP